MGTAALFPPSLYPAAQVDDVKHHLFPVHSKDHWVLFHVYYSQANCHADFFSSLPGYEFEVDTRWPHIVEQMLLFSERRLDLASVEVQNPKLQPCQSNVYDCGVLALCVARWIIEGWGLETIQPQNCRLYRQRMIVECKVSFNVFLLFSSSPSSASCPYAMRCIPQDYSMASRQEAALEKTATRWRRCGKTIFHAS